MKRSAYILISLLLVSIIIVLCHLNNRYEVFALNVTRGRREKRGEYQGDNVNPGLINGDASDALLGIIDDVDRHNPDIVCFQELSPSVFSKINNALDSLFGYSDSMSIKKEKLRYWLYSKKPILNSTRYKFLTEIDPIGYDSISKIEIKQI